MIAVPIRDPRACVPQPRRRRSAAAAGSRRRTGGARSATTECARARSASSHISRVKPYRRDGFCAPLRVGCAGRSRRRRPSVTFLGRRRLTCSASHRSKLPKWLAVVAGDPDSVGGRQHRAGRRQHELAADVPLRPRRHARSTPRLERAFERHRLDEAHRERSGHRHLTVEDRRVPEHLVEDGRRSSRRGRRRGRPRCRMRTRSRTWRVPPRRVCSVGQPEPAHVPCAARAAQGHTAVGSWRCWKSLPPTNPSSCSAYSRAGSGTEPEQEDGYGHVR